jgi:hypothetical protein
MQLARSATEGAVMTMFVKLELRLVVGLGLLAALSLPSREAAAACEEFTWCGQDCVNGCMAMGGDPYSCYYACAGGCVSGTWDPATWEFGCTVQPPPPPPPPEPPTKNVLLLHGRSMTDWPGCAKSFPTNLGLPATTAGDSLQTINATWNWKSLAYDGNQRVADTKAQISSFLVDNCTGGDTCVVACYSAGCLRLLASLEDVGPSLTGLQWSFALSSAAGGSDIMELENEIQGAAWFFDSPELRDRFEPIDQDLKVSVARGQWAAAQDASPVPMYHAAGGGTLCYTSVLDTDAMFETSFVTSILSLICGGNGDAVADFLKQAWRNAFITSTLEFVVCNGGLTVKVGGEPLTVIESPLQGRNDGAVAFHSTLGYRYPGAYTGIGQGALYNNRVPLYIADQSHHLMMLDLMRTNGYPHVCGENPELSVAEFGDPCGDTAAPSAPYQQIIGWENCDGVDNCNPYYYWGPNGQLWPLCPSFGDYGVCNPYQQYEIACQEACNNYYYFWEQWGEGWWPQKYPCVDCYVSYYEAAQYWCEGSDYDPNTNTCTLYIAGQYWSDYYEWCYLSQYDYCGGYPW